MLVLTCRIELHPPGPQPSVTTFFTSSGLFGALGRILTYIKRGCNPLPIHFGPPERILGTPGRTRTAQSWLRRPGSDPVGWGNSRSNTPLPNGVVGS